MTEPVVERRRGTLRRRILIVFIVASLLALVAQSAFGVFASQRLRGEVSRIERRHGSLDAGTLAVADVPPDQNRARAIRAASGLINYAPVKSWSDLQASYSAFLKQPPPAPMPADLRAFVEANRTTLRVVDDARARPHSNWEVDYATEASFPRLLDIRTLSNAIYLTALFDLEAGRPDDAARSITSGLSMSASLRQEPTFIVQLIRMAVAMQHFEAVQRLLSASEPSKASLEDLSRWLAENRSPDPMSIGVLTEMKFLSARMAQFEAGEGRWFGWLGRPWVRWQWADCLEQMEHMLDIQTGSRPRPVRRVVDPHIFCPTGPGMDRAIETGDLFNSELGLTELAVGLRRYRLEQGQYPDALTALVPTYVASVPIDPFTGKPPVYSREGTGFRLHGENGSKSQGLTVAALEWNVPK